MRSLASPNSASGPPASPSTEERRIPFYALAQRDGLILDGPARVVIRRKVVDKKIIPTREEYAKLLEEIGKLDERAREATKLVQLLARDAPPRGHADPVERGRFREGAVHRFGRGCRDEELRNADRAAVSMFAEVPLGDPGRWSRCRTGANCRDRLEQVSDSVRSRSGRPTEVYASFLAAFFREQRNSSWSGLQDDFRLDWAQGRGDAGGEAIRPLKGKTFPREGKTSSLKASATMRRL